MKLWIIYDTILLEYQGEVDIEKKWSDLYYDVVEDIPPDIPYTKVKHVGILSFVGAHHYHDIDTRRSGTVLLMLLKKTQIQCYSKIQNIVET